jgi:uncharacterized membrane protein
MSNLVVATAAFLATHFVASTPLRGKLIQALGQRPYLGLYSLVAAVTFVWMIVAFAGASREALWAGWRLVPLVLMPIAIVFVACAFAPNPTAVGGERLLKREEPARGMLRVTRHPLMWGLMLWSASHILASGTLRSVVFFGGFLVLAAFGSLSIDARKKSEPDWRRFAAVTSHVPFVAIAQGRNRLDLGEIGWVRPLAGLAAFALFFWLHPWLFGARPY